MADGVAEGLPAPYAGEYRGGPVEPEPRENRLAATAGLTDKQKRFVVGYIANGGNAEAAADAAGYSYPQSDAWRLLRQAHIAEAIRRERAVTIETQGATVAWATMHALMTQPQYSGAVKFQAAKWTLENSGHGLAAQRAALGLPASDKPLGEMDLSELQNFIQTAAVAVQTLQQQQERTIDVTPAQPEPPVAPDIVRDDEASG